MLIDVVKHREMNSDISSKKRLFLFGQERLKYVEHFVLMDVIKGQVENKLVQYFRCRNTQYLYDLTRN